MDGVVAYILGKSYVKKSLIGIGALAGAPCQVQSINKVGKTTTITLKWEDNVGGVHTQAFDVEDGADGVSVTNATINANGHLILTLSNGNSIDCGQVLPQYDTMPIPSASNEGQILQYIGTTTSNYTNGYFYECINDGGTYKWVEKSVQDSYTKGQIGSLSDLPDTSKNVIENIADIKLSVDQLSASKLSISDIDNALSDVSENPVQNKVIKLTLDQLRGSILDKLDNKEDRFRVTLLPLGSADLAGKIVQYIGNNTSSLTKGYFYQCIEVSTGVYDWVQKNVQPSGGGTGGDGVVDGYYNSTDHLFYEESTFINPITGDDNTLYISLDTNLLYRYNGLIFIRVDESSSGEDDVINGYYNTTNGKFYEDSTYTTEIVGQTGKIYISIDTNIQYRWDNISVPNKFVTISSSIAVDNQLSTTSENPVQNKVITLTIDQLQGSVLNKIQKMLGAQEDNFAIIDNDGGVKDSGISKDVVPITASASNKLLVASDLSVKADKVSGATNDDIALLDSTGNLKDSNKKLSDYQEKLTDGNGINIDASNNISLDITYLTASKVGYIPATEKGSNNGVAELDNTGKVPSSQLPSYVDDVIEGYYNETDGKFYEDSAYTTEIVGQSGVIYISVDTDIQYRWTGTAFAALGGALQLGETSSTAYRGDRGKIAYDHSQIKDGSNPHNTTADNVNLKVPIPALSGSKLDVESTLYGINTALGTKADKVASATSGHLAGLDGNGNLTDSGVVANDVIQKVATATGLLKDDGTVDTTSYAPSANAYLVGDTAETTIDDADYFPFYDTSATGKRKTLFSSIVNKLKNTFATLVTGTFTSGNFVSLDSNGNIADSGKKASDFVGTSDIYKSIKVNNTGATGSTAKYIKIENAYPTSLVNALVYNISAGYGDSEILTLSTKQDNTRQTPVLNLITRTNIARLSELKYDTNGDIYIRIDAYTTATVTQIAGATITSFSVSLIDVSDLPLTVTDGIIINSVNKIDKVSSATQNDIAIFDANGGVADSNVLISSLPTIAPIPASGLTESDIVDAVNSATATNANAPSLYGVQKYSNEKTVRRVLNGANIPSGTSMTATGIGTWFDGDISTIVPSTDEADWWYDSAFIVPVYYVLTSDTSIVTGKTYYTRSGTAPNYTYTVVASPVVADIGTYYEQYSDDIELSFKFDPSSGEPTALGGYILDTTTGKLCIKFANSITPLKARIAVDITYTRNEVV